MWSSNERPPSAWSKCLFGLFGWVAWGYFLTILTNMIEFPMKTFRRLPFICGSAQIVVVLWSLAKRIIQIVSLFYERQTSAKAEPLFDPDQELNLRCRWVSRRWKWLYLYLWRSNYSCSGMLWLFQPGRKILKKIALVVQKYHALPKDITFSCRKVKTCHS